MTGNDDGRLAPDAISYPGDGVEIRDFERAVNAAIVALGNRSVSQRIWRRDYTVWKPDPTEIADRLGWLEVSREMRQQTADLRAFAEDVRSAGFRHTALLGMGGSSLGAMALRGLFGSAEGFPELTVIDTTIPDAIISVSDYIDCRETLFVVASKSGTTIEPNALYRYFRALVEQTAGVGSAGSHFAAICDAGTELERLAVEENFRGVFTNPPDIGGRYSVQSLFGLAPAALIGMELELFLDAVEKMGDACGPGIPANDNPGARLGATIAASAGVGRDKLTIVTTESLREFGLWIEQLLAESTGKEGGGIIPIVDEPLVNPAHLTNDRLFVYVRLEGDDADETDAYINRVVDAGVPTIRLNLTDKYDIGAEIFRWEFATAVAGSLLKINPFDQPDVQQSKDQASELLEEYGKSGQTPDIAAAGSLARLMSRAASGDYLAITAFASPTKELESAVARLRSRITQTYGIATTFGYGPRYLHSTGQLHKGGRNNGLFLQLTQIGDVDVAVPGEAYTFGALAAAQARGDLEALAARGRPVARVRLGHDAARTIDALNVGDKGRSSVR